ncbi:PIN domain-containing protein [Candidatus Sumerlaeota bacterium]|nr:PIN domain-containing protein [Candidatus Sumerlaeota bacterium]
MKAIFVDTSGWMACADGADPAHRPACDARDAALRDGQSLVTTDYVVDETLTLIRMRIGLSAAEEWWKQIENSSRIRWEWIGVARTEKARQIFFSHSDKGYSFTGCTSFVVMKELKLKEVLTADIHFRQMGFQVIPPLLHRRR